MLIERDRSALVVIDVQSRLVPAIDHGLGVIQGASTLLGAAGRLGLPTLVSEQYPKGLGHTVDALKPQIPEGSVAEKVHFSCMRDPGFAERFQAFERDQAVICGMETHVCVLQTALGLLAEGVEVYVAADAVSSRTPENKALGLERMRAAGCHVVSVEMVVFEWMEKAGTPEFKELSALIK